MKCCSIDSRVRLAPGVQRFCGVYFAAAGCIGFLGARRKNIRWWGDLIASSPLPFPLPCGPQVAILVLDLRKRGVSSLPTLVEQWRQDPTYLKSSVGLWVKVGCKPRFEKAWANTVKTAVAASKGAGAQVRRGAGGVISTSGGPTGEREEGPRKRSRA